MRFIKIIFIAVLFFALGYFAGNLYPLPFPIPILISGPSSLIGEVELKVRVITDKEMPVPDLEVDIDFKLPPSPNRLIAVTTDNNGIATFYLKPGIYFPFFNLNNFPPHLKHPTQAELPQLKVQEGKINEATIILKKKSEN